MDVHTAQRSSTDRADVPAGAPAVVREAWERCHAYGLDRRSIPSCRLDPVGLRRARDQSRRLIESAEPFLQTLHQVLANEPHFVGLVDRDGIVISLLAGPASEETVRLLDVVEGVSLHERDRGCNGMGTALAIGCPVVIAGSEHFLIHDASWTSVGIPLHDGGGSVVGVLGLGVPIAGIEPHLLGWATSVAGGIEAVVARARKSNDVVRFLADASTLLASSFDYEPTLGEVTRLAVPLLADWCVVQVVDDDGLVRPVAAAHVEPEKQDLVQRLFQRDPLDSSAPGGIAAIPPGEQTVFCFSVEDACLNDLEPNAERRELIRALGARSLIVAPLVRGGRTLGTLTCVVGESGRCYDEADVAVVEDLARRLAMTIDNARLYRQARAAIRARDELLTSVSHDLRGPLGNVKGYAQLLHHRLASQAPTDVSQMIDVLKRVDAIAERMSLLVDELLEMARTQLGRPLALNCQPVDLVALVRGVIAEYQQIEARHHVLVAASETDLIGCWDASRLERVFANLLVNAIKYSPDGGDVEIGIARDHPSGTWAILSVGDHGLGIPASDLPRVFEPFHRASNVSRKFVGTGAGLASVKQIVDQHGGTVSIESVEGEGTTVTVRLPLSTS